jgi:hypothetical protein
MSDARRFLIKVEASNCPDEAGQPKAADDWEGKNFETGAPQKRSKGKEFPVEQTRNPEPGDKLLIWVNGSGLTATAEVRIFQNKTVTVQNIQLLPDPRLDDSDLKKPNAAPALSDLARNRPTKLRFLTTEGWEAICDAAKLKGDQLSSEEAAQELARRKTLGEQATRRGQQKFSETMRNIYQGQCAITRCNTSAALQASHIRVQRDSTTTAHKMDFFSDLTFTHCSTDILSH